MYYCKNCKKYIKQGNVCDTCGKKMTADDGIIFCPKCNKSFFNPGMNKKFTCQNCNTMITVNEELLRNQRGKTEVNKIDTNKSQANNSENNSNSINNLGSVFSQIDNESKNEQNDNKVVDSTETENKFQHGQINESKEQQKNNVEIDDTFDENLFEDATAKDAKASKAKDRKNKERDKDNGRAKKGSSMATFVLISIVFVVGILAIIYFYVLPLLIPTYKQNWEKYVSAQNDMNYATGKKTKINTVNFEVQSKTQSQVVAVIKVEEKVYNEDEQKYDYNFMTYNVLFVKKDGNFVIYNITEIE